MFVILCFLGALIIALGNLLWRRGPRPVEVDETGNVSRIQDLRILKARHETAKTLAELIDKDGAGAWPPKANHDSWPMALRPYKDIYLELVPLLPAAEPSLDDDINTERRNRYRSLMRKLLSDRINVTQVEEIMAAVEAGNWNVLSRDAYNGFYACVAVCRHAYRYDYSPSRDCTQTKSVLDGQHFPLSKSLNSRRLLTYQRSSMCLGLTCNGTSASLLTAEIIQQTFCTTLTSKVKEFIRSTLVCRT
jgi:hypothetical protein